MSEVGIGAEATLQSDGCGGERAGTGSGGIAVAENARYGDVAVHVAGIGETVDGHCAGSDDGSEVIEIGRPLTADADAAGAADHPAAGKRELADIDVGDAGVGVVVAGNGRVRPNRAVLGDRASAGDILGGGGQVGIAKKK